MQSPDINSFHHLWHDVESSLHKWHRDRTSSIRAKRKRGATRSWTDALRRLFQGKNARVFVSGFQIWEAECKKLNVFEVVEDDPSYLSVFRGEKNMFLI